MQEFNYGDVVVIPVPWDSTGITYTLDERDFAVMLDVDGRIVDVATNRETTESMTLEGYIPVPVGAEVREAMGEALAALVDVYDDCWGRERPTA